MEEILEDFRRAVANAKDFKPVKQETTVNSALDMAVLHYKQEKEKQEKKARLFAL